MSLAPCPECGKPVSSQARACPNCGYPLKQSAAVKQLFPRTATKLQTSLAWITTAVSAAYLFLFMVGLANNTKAAAWEVVVFLPAIAVVVIAAWLFRTYVSVAVVALLTAVAFSLMMFLLLGQYLWGTYADSSDGAGIGLGLSIVFALQWRLLGIVLVLAIVVSVIERIWFMTPHHKAALPEKIIIPPFNNDQNGMSK